VRIATASVPSRDDLLVFLRARHRGVLVTTRRDGSPQLSPVSCGLSGEQLVVSTYPSRAKAHNARRDPRVSMCVLSDEWDGPYVQVDGTAEVIDLPGAVEALVDYYRNIAGEHPDWDDYRAAMVRQGKCLIRITITRWGPIATGGFPADIAASIE
jgi:PPOX class probable F420-dependent enzyme